VSGEAKVEEMGRRVGGPVPAAVEVAEECKAGWEEADSDLVL
jgi:hypothetical protein